MSIQSKLSNLCQQIVSKIQICVKWLQPLPYAKGSIFIPHACRDLIQSLNETIEKNVKTMEKRYVPEQQGCYGTKCCNSTMIMAPRMRSLLHILTTKFFV